MHSNPLVNQKQENTVRLQKLHSDAVVPEYATPGAACFDLVTVEGGKVYPGESCSFGTGLAFEIPDGHVLMVYSRSGHGFKHHIRLVNTTGVIDSDYRGEVRVGLYNDGESVFRVEPGDRIAQAMVIPVDRVGFKVVDSLSSTERGAGGFGSTGKK